MLGAFGVFNTTGLRSYGVSQEPSAFLTKMLYVPAPSPVKLPEGCQFVPPSIEYSSDAPVAAMVIVPSFTPQFDGSAGVTLVMTGSTLSIRVIFGLETSQVPPTFLTRIS